MKFNIHLSIFMISLLHSSFVTAGCINLNPSLTVSKPDTMYVDNNDGTVTDNNTGLTWQKCPLGLSGVDCLSGSQLSFTWSAAHSAANINTQSGYSDWRIPNKNELLSLVEYACWTPAINSSIFPIGPIALNASGDYWTSTPSTVTPNAVWGISFEDGGVLPYRKDSLFFVRLVRGTLPLEEPQTVIQD